MKEEEQLLLLGQERLQHRNRLGRRADSKQVDVPLERWRLRVALDVRAGFKRLTAEAYRALTCFRFCQA